MKQNVLVLALAAAVLSSRAAHAGFRVGAAVADMTPPAFDPASHEPPIDAPGFDGPRRWDFEEPYVDVNGDGYWDPGEPYVDENHNGRYDGIFLGGGGGRDAKPPTKVADPVTARAFVVDDGSRRIAVEVLDVIGMFNSDLEKIRAAVRASLGDGGLDEIFISSTHDESAPDVIGLWGPGLLAPVGNGIGSSGVNDYWMDFAIERAAQAVVAAYRVREPATIRFAETTQPENFLTCWSSYPYVRASKIPILQALSTATGKALITLVNYGIHAETLGFNRGAVAEQQYWISADWPYWMRRRLEDRFGGTAIQMAGAVGSVETPKVFPGGTVSAVPTGQYEAGHPAGCRTVFATGGDAVPVGYFDETRVIGEAVADRAIAALQTSAVPSSSEEIRFERRRFFAPISNDLFVAAAFGQSFPRRPAYVAGVEVPQPSQMAADPAGTLLGLDAPSPNAGTTEVKTEVAVYAIGDGQFITTPGEHFPIGLIRGFQGPEDMPFPDDPISDFVTAHMTGKFRFIEGLGEDMIGYLFPKANAVGVPGERPLEPMAAIQHQDATAAVPNTDRFGCSHSDDSEAASGDAGDIVSAALVDILDGFGPNRDRVLAGRWIWPDGSLHRNPLGDGTLGCSGAFKVFSPAPGAPLGVVVRDGDRLRRFALPGSPLAGEPADGLVDYAGVAQGGSPTVDTRGIVLADGARIFVDVYPDWP